MKSRCLLIIGMFILLSCEKLSDTEILKFYGDAYEDIGYSIAGSESGYMIAGQFNRISRSDGRIVKNLKKLAVIETGYDGKEIRKDTAVNNLESCATRIISPGDGSSVAAGYAVDALSGQKDIYVVKFAPKGEGCTEKVLRIEGNQYANDIVKINGGYIVLGTTDAEDTSIETGNAKGKKNIFLLSLNDNLEVITSRQWGFKGNDEAVTMKADANGYVIVGTTDLYESSTGTDVFILPLNENLENLNPQGARYFQIPGQQSAADLEVTNDGYLIAGNTIVNGSSAGYIWKITGGILGSVEHHLIVFEKTFTINALCSYKKNSFLIAGQYGLPESGSMLIFETDMLGYPVEGNRKIAGGTGNQVAYDVLADGEDIIAVGKNSYDNNSMIAFLKFRF